MSIQETKGEINFLHTLKEGPANRSYGIQVAQLAGLPAEVTRRAKGLLIQLESFNSPQSSQMTLLDIPPPEEENQPESGKNDELLEEIKSTPIQTLTPLEALNRIASWQQNLS